MIGSVLLGIAVHGARDTWGLTHICLQPLILLALAFLAAKFATLTGPWKILLIVGALLDLLLGIVLHFALQHDVAGVLRADYNAISQMNLAAKRQLQLGFLGDAWPFGAWPLGALLLGLLAMATRRTRRSNPPASPVTRP